MDTTSRLLLQKPDPDPVTGDIVDIGVLNDNMDKIDAVINSTVCTSSTRPVAPFQGQVILETDTGRVYIRLGGAWTQIAVGGSSRMLANIEFERATVGDWAISAHVAADTQKRFILDAAGKMQWGPGGSTAPDVNLYRRGVNHLGTDDSFQAGGFCSGAAAESIRTTNSANITTVETVIQSVTFNAVSGAGYIINAVQNYQSTLANDLVRIRLRWAAGASVTASGTQLLTVMPNCDIVGRGQPITLNKLFIPNVTGQVTVGVTMVKDNASAGVVTSSGQADRMENTITVVGA